MTLAKFIYENRQELTDCIKAVVPNIGRLTNADIEEWIMNDESLYSWAQEEGVTNL